MEFLPLRLWLCLLASTVFGREILSQPTLSAPQIQELIPGLSYIVQLPCIDCPYRKYHDDPSGYFGWEVPPRPNSLLLNFTMVPNIPGHFPNDLLLNGLDFSPCYYERRSPLYMSQPFPFTPPFDAYQVIANITQLDLDSLYPLAPFDRDDRPYGLQMESFHLAYEYVSYKSIGGNILLEFRVDGLRKKGRGSHVTEGRTTSMVRIVMNTNNPEEQWKIDIIQLVPNIPVMDAAGAQSESHGDSIAGPDWGGRRDMNADELWTDWVFKPEEWNDCGRKDHPWRQFLCKVEDLGLNLAGFIVVCVIVVLMLVALLGLTGLLLWKHWQRKAEEASSEEEETGPLLTATKEDLDHGPEKIEEVLVSIEEPEEVVEEFGPFEHNVGDAV